MNSEQLCFFDYRLFCLLHLGPIYTQTGSRSDYQLDRSPSPTTKTIRRLSLPLSEAILKSRDLIDAHLESTTQFAYSI